VTVNRVVVDELSARGYTVGKQTEDRPSAKSADISADCDGASRPMTDTDSSVDIMSGVHDDDDDVNVENILLMSVNAVRLVKQTLVKT